MSSRIHTASWSGRSSSGGRLIWVALQKTFIASSASSAPSTLGVAMSISTSCAISGHVCSTCRCKGAA